MLAMALRNLKRGMRRAFCTRYTLPCRSCCSKKESQVQDGPLTGVRVLDLTRILAGPYCTMILGDLGAEIIKVEKPEVGDDTRTWGPPFSGPFSCYFISVNRNKRSIAIDLKKPQGQELIRKLVAKSDILVENYLPGTLDKLGLGYETLKGSHPGLIYCSITGYGPTGPYSKRGGYDVIAASIGGLLEVTGPRGGEPCKVGVALTDLATGLYAHGAILAALLQRSKTGQGTKIDVNLLSTQIATLVNLSSNYLNGGKVATRWGSAHESIVPYQAFLCKGGRWMTIGCGNNDLYSQFCTAIGLEDLTSDPDFKTNELRVQNRGKLIQILEKRMGECTLEEWLELFKVKGVKFPYGPINDMEGAFKDPQVIHNGMVQELDGFKLVSPPVTYSTGGNYIRRSPPTLGGDTRDVLSSLLQLNEMEINQLYTSKIVA